MSTSPNVRFAASALKSSNKQSTAKNSQLTPSFLQEEGVKFVTIGKDSITVPIPTMASVNEAAYLKAACFLTLSSMAYGLLDKYTPATVMMFVAQQLPIDTSMALTEASNIGPAI